MQNTFIFIVERYTILDKDPFQIIFSQCLETFIQWRFHCSLIDSVIILENCNLYRKDFVPVINTSDKLETFLFS